MILIITASRRTDLPAFFGQWFMQRIAAGFFHAVNPFNPRQVKRVGLAQDEIDAIVFFSKNPAPFIRHLDELEQRGYRYYFQYTLNDYPLPFEPKVPPVEERLASFRRLSERLGPRRVIWRYDPIILSSATPPSFHLEKVERLARELSGSTTRLVISFFDPYRKAEPRLKSLEREYGVVVRDSLQDPGLCLQMAAGIRAIGDRLGMEVVSCAEPIDLTAAGVRHGSCVDAQLIRELFGVTSAMPRDRSQRSECGCAKAVDMGCYDTCRFGCVYCYASAGDRVITRNLARHSPDLPCMVGNPELPQAKE